RANRGRRFSNDFSRLSPFSSRRFSNMNAAAANENSAGPKPAKQGPSIVRIVLIAVLLVMVGLLVFDWRARGACDAAYNAIDTADNEAKQKEGGAGLTPDEVRALAGFDCTTKEVKDHYILETYAWRGAFREYFVYVAY